MSDYIKLGTVALVALFIVWFSYDLGYEKAKVDIANRLAQEKARQHLIGIVTRAKVE